MNIRKVLGIAVFLIGLAGAVYYAAVDKETQGAVVVLAAILYFLALPELTRQRQ